MFAKSGIILYMTGVSFPHTFSEHPSVSRYMNCSFQTPCYLWKLGVMKSRSTKKISSWRHRSLLVAMVSQQLCSMTNAGRVHYVANPITKKFLTLPQTTHHYIYPCSGTTGFGYAASIGAYKVVKFWLYERRGGGIIQNIYCCEILTLGVDKSWRCISDYRGPMDHDFDSPLSIKGFLYWAYISSPTIQAFDVETELFHFFDIPKGLKSKMIINFLPMGDYLAVVGKRQGLTWEVWVSREVKMVGEEWTRLPDINLESHSYLFVNFPDHLGWELLPVGWLKEGELVLLRRTGQLHLLFVYNVKTGEASSFEIDVGISFPHNQILPHVRSLVSI